MGSAGAREDSPTALPVQELGSVLAWGALLGQGGHLWGPQAAPSSRRCLGVVSWWVRRCRPLWPLACLNSGDCTAEVLDEGADQARILEEYEFAGKCGVPGSPGCRGYDGAGL